MTLDQNIKLHPVEYRQATAAQFAVENPVLPVGQMAREKDRRRIKFGDGVSAYSSLPYAVDTSLPTDRSGVSGAVVIDCSLGSVFTLSLTGNVTSFTLSNLVNGKLIEVHFVQDATGSRTLAGVNALIKLAGDGLVLSTASGKRDVLTLRTLGNIAVEVSRSVIPVPVV